jgi:hypothetical protein
VARPDDEPAELLLVRGDRVHRMDERGRLIEVTGPERLILLGEAEAARVLSRLSHLPGWVRGGRE